MVPNTSNMTLKPLTKIATVAYAFQLIYRTIHAQDMHITGCSYAPYCRYKVAKFFGAPAQLWVNNLGK